MKNFLSFFSSKQSYLLLSLLLLALFATAQFFLNRQPTPTPPAPSSTPAAFSFFSPLFTKAYTAYQQKAYAQALTWLEQIELKTLAPQEKRLYYYLLAACFYRQGFFVKALQGLEKITALPLPVSPAVFLLLALNYEKLGAIPTAFSYYEKALALRSDYYPAYEKKAELYLRQAFYFQAAETYQSALTLSQGRAPSITLKLALTYYLLEHYSKSELLLEGLSSLEQNRFLPRLYFLKALNHRAQHRTNQAALFFANAVATAKREQASFYGYAQASYALESGASTLALQLLEKQADSLGLENPYFVPSTNLLAWLHLVQANYQQSYFYYQKLLSAPQPLSPLMSYFTAFNEFKLQRYETALRRVSLILKTLRNATALGLEEKKQLLLFSKLLQLRLYVARAPDENFSRVRASLEQLEQLEQQSEASPALFAVKKEKLLLHFRFDRRQFFSDYQRYSRELPEAELAPFRPFLLEYLESIKDYNSALSLIFAHYQANSHTAASFYKLAELYLRLKDDSAATRYFRLALEKSETEVERGRALSGLALLKHRRGDWQAAEELLKPVSKIPGLKIGAWYNLALFARSRSAHSVFEERLVTAQRILEESRSQEKNLTSSALKVKLYLLLSEFYVQKKQLAKARRVLVKASALAPQNETISYLMKKYLAF